VSDRRKERDSDLLTLERAGQATQIVDQRGDVLESNSNVMEDNASMDSAWDASVLFLRVDKMRGKQVRQLTRVGYVTCAR
jgi:hypothetical protein